MEVETVVEEDEDEEEEELILVDALVTSRSVPSCPGLSSC
jgi:hypothetical protein